MERVFLTYRTHSMELREGVTVVGRGLACQMRFNDPSMSREHLRIRVDGSVATVEDLQSRNGSLLNGKPISGIVRVEDGDVLEVGNRRLRVRIEAADRPFDERTVSAVTTYPALAAVSETPEPVRVSRASGRQQRCPECKNPVTMEDDFCKSCGYSWADFRPGTVTRRVERVDDPEAAGRERRRHARHRVEVPVLYTSDNLTVETMALNLSRGGIFVRTQILDEIGTECELTVMAEGAPALTLYGVVRRVVDRQDMSQPLGLGIEFTAVNPTAQRWLDDMITRLCAS